MTAPIEGATPLADAWQVLNRGEPHPSTCKIYEKETPDEPELHCDLVFVNDELARRVRRYDVDQKTQASDHQPVIVAIEN
jgi:endonuclease/exonuclease/phosphatase family metal-dependent hydrolase